MTKTSRHLPWYRPGRWQWLKNWALGLRCENPLHNMYFMGKGTGKIPIPCARRAIGRFVLAQEFGTVQADLCLKCHLQKLDEILRSEWGQYEIQQASIRGTPYYATSTWSTMLEEYKPNWVGRVLLKFGLDR